MIWLSSQYYYVLRTTIVNSISATFIHSSQNCWRQPPLRHQDFLCHVPSESSVWRLVKGYVSMHLHLSSVVKLVQGLSNDWRVCCLLAGSEDIWTCNLVSKWETSQGAYSKISESHIFCQMRPAHVFKWAGQTMSEMCSIVLCQLICGSSFRISFLQALHLV